MEEAKLKELLELIEQWTRAEILARHAPLVSKDFACYAHVQVEKGDEIRRLVFGTDDLLKLGLKWGLLQEYKAQTKEDLKQQFLKLQKQLSEMEDS